jgi:hypothetical protein
MLTVHVPPAATGVLTAQVPPVMATPAPDTDTPVGVAGALPVFVTTELRGIELPAAAEPKAPDENANGPGVEMDPDVIM